MTYEEFVQQFCRGEEPTPTQRGLIEAFLQMPMVQDLAKEREQQQVREWLIDFMSSGSLRGRGPGRVGRTGGPPA